MATPEERLEQAERTVRRLVTTLKEATAATERALGVLGTTLDAVTDMTQTIQLRLLALQTALIAKGVVADAEIMAELQALSDAATLELEYGDDPLSQQFRRMRRLAEGGDEPPKAGRPQQDAVEDDLEP
jgi:hypothetical protein